MEKQLKIVTGLFSFCVVGIVLCFGMSVFTAVKENQKRNAPPDHFVPTPAIQ